MQHCGDDVEREFSQLAGNFERVRERLRGVSASRISEIPLLPPRLPEVRLDGGECEAVIRTPITEAPGRQQSLSPPAALPPRRHQKQLVQVRAPAPSQPYQAPTVCPAEAVSFTPISAITTFKGAVRLNSCFVGVAEKLSAGNRWQRRLFSVDHGSLVCYRNETSDRPLSGCILLGQDSPPLQLRVPDCSGRACFRRPKWVLAIGRLRSIHILTRTGPPLPKAKPPRSLRSLGSRAEFRWLDLVPVIARDCKLSLQEMERISRLAVGRVIRLTTGADEEYFLRVDSDSNFYRWLVILSAKKLLFS